MFAVFLFAALTGGGPLTVDDAVATALQRNRDLIAARLDIEASQLDRVAAGIYPNPIFSYSLGNIVLGGKHVLSTSWISWDVSVSRSAQIHSGGDEGVDFSNNDSTSACQFTVSARINFFSKSL